MAERQLVLRESDFFFLRYVFIHFRETKCARVEGGGGGERSKWGERGRERKEERRSS